MTAIREIVDSSSLANIVKLPPAFTNRKVELIVFPVEETAKEMPKFTKAQIEEAAKSPKVQAIVGVLKDAGLPPDTTIKDIRQMRLEEKYGEYFK